MLKVLASRRLFSFARVPDRHVLRISGPDAKPYLQGLITQNVNKLEQQRLLYSAFLSSTGRVMFDAFVYAHGSGDNELLVECDNRVSDQLKAHLRRYKLRSRVQFEDVSDLKVVQVVGNSPEDIQKQQKFQSLVKDPRHVRLGYRALCSDDRSLRSNGNSEFDYQLLRFHLGIPEGNSEFTPGELIPQESNLDLLNAIDYHKGCYVGQELVIRTHHRGVVRKRIMPIKMSLLSENEFAFDKEANFSITQYKNIYARVSDRQDGVKSRPLGKLIATYHNVGLALMRLDSVTDIIQGEGGQSSDRMFSETDFFIIDDSDQSINVKVSKSALL